MAITRKDLSEEQEIAFQYIMEFISSAKRQMLFYGSAGTGKSSLLNCLIDHIEANTDNQLICTAPTNEAVRIISKLTNRDYDQTIYSVMGLVLLQEDDREPKLVVGGESSMSAYDIIFIDECSMIDSEMFALINNQLELYSRVKIIYIGDSAQLPPVKDKGIDSPVFKLPDTVGLKSVQRVSEGNPIIQTVTLIRNNLDSAVDVFPRETILIDDKTGIEFITDKEEFLRKMYSDFLSDDYKNDDDFVRVAAYTNKTVTAMNTHIRRKLYNTREVPEYMVDEKVIVDVPITKDRRGKGKQIFKEMIYTVGERLMIKSATLTTDYEFGIKYWDMTVVNYEEKTWKQKVSYIKVIHKNSVDTYKKALSTLAQNAKEMLRTQDSRGKYPSKGVCWSPFYAMKSEYAWLKYRYCSTVHKLQGSTVKNVYVIENDMNRLTWNHSERNKLKYVAFTRASKLLRVYS